MASQHDANIILKKGGRGNVKFQLLLCSELLNNTSVSGNFMVIYLKQ